MSKLENLHADPEDLVVVGSSAGGIEALNEFASMLGLGTSGQLNATTYVRFMTHTAAVNIGIYFGLKGRVFVLSIWSKPVRTPV